MSVPVYFADFRTRTEKRNTVSKIAMLLDRLGLASRIGQGDLVAIKLHFGELGNDSFITPVFVRTVVDAVRACGGKPFLTDCNTLYSGSRSNAADHLETAVRHGFDFSVAGAPVIIADGLKGRNWREVAIGRKRFSSVKIANDILDADVLIALSHFKAHEMAGFGGAIKNLAMGCAPAAGKRDQHSTRQVVNEDECVGCGSCARVCPQGAITVAGGKAHIDHAKCIGCGECMTVCPKKAIDIDWTVGIEEFMEKLTEYAYGSVASKLPEGKALFLNFVMKVVPDCDCCPWSDAPIVPDLGILASADPVAIDTASLDLVNAAPALPGTILDRKLAELKPGVDKFRAIHPNTRPEIQLDYGQEIGLGTRTYSLERI